MEWNGMEWNGSVRTTKRQSRHKTAGQSLLHAPLSARSELHSHPLAEQAQASQRRKSLPGPMAPVVTTGGYSVKKSHTSFLRCGPCYLLVMIATALRMS